LGVNGNPDYSYIQRLSHAMEMDESILAWADRWVSMKYYPNHPSSGGDPGAEFGGDGQFFLADPDFRMKFFRKEFW